MIEGKRVVCFTPYGRERTVSILKNYLQRDHERGIVDEWWLCLNTDERGQETDLAYGYTLAARSGGWIKAVNRPKGLPRLTPKQRNTGYFYRYMTDPDTVYVRFDDDMIYVHHEAIENLVRARVAMHASTLTAFAFIVNNAICSWFGQRCGLIPTTIGEVGSPYCMDQVGWASGGFAVGLHNHFLGLLADGGDQAVTDRFSTYQDFPLDRGQQFSVSCFACDGRDYAALDHPGVLTYPEEEYWHTVHRPEECGKSNVIVGNAVVSHYTFFPQQKQMLVTDILDRYRTYSERI